ncbi:hypothetical protein LXH09_36190 [Streptomyces sp. CS7]|uniref:hypothetical protein n=1 Tax=Streptomyces sp. CS-7 TaxID=2906769 RepID=UPI0021B3B5BD|nr:hypothetical protein [Streptomyces sp. CS-7]MCT6782071.1 hypothetical protein [Streptomyces sp. CS-7]
MADAADVLAASPEARALVTELLLTGRRNGLVVRTEERRPLTQYPTPDALDEAAANPQ